MGGLKIPFGERNDKMYAADELPTGIFCGATCPACGGLLIAKNRQFSARRRAAHFSHASSATCIGGAETAVHRMAKQILLESSFVRLPEFYAETATWARNNTRHEVNLRVESTLAQYDSARSEVSYDGFRPDVVLTGAFGEYTELLVEICVEHPVGEAKKTLLKSQGRFVMELSLPQQCTELGLDLFRYAVLDGGCRDWISHPANEERFAQKKAQMHAGVSEIDARHAAHVALSARGAAAVEQADAATRYRVHKILARQQEEAWLVAKAREMARRDLETVGWKLRPDHASRGARLADRHRQLARVHDSALQCSECCWLNPPGARTCEECQSTRLTEWPLCASRLAEMPHRLNCHPGFRGMKVRTIESNSGEAISVDPHGQLRLL